MLGLHKFNFYKFGHARLVNTVKLCSFIWQKPTCSYLANTQIELFQHLPIPAIENFLPILLAASIAIEVMECKNLSAMVIFSLQSILYIGKVVRLSSVHDCKPIFILYLYLLLLFSTGK